MTWNHRLRPLHPSTKILATIAYNHHELYSRITELIIRQATNALWIISKRSREDSTEIRCGFHHFFFSYCPEGSEVRLVTAHTCMEECLPVCLSVCLFVPFL